jgi:hypothetical protein
MRRGLKPKWLTAAIESGNTADDFKISLKEQGMRELGALVCVVGLAGCAAGTNFSWEDTERVHPGMTEQEVVAILGKPYTRQQSNGQTTKLVWAHAGAFSGPKAVSFTFENGKVVGSKTVGQ